MIPEENHEAQIKILNAILIRLDRIDESMREKANHEIG